MRYQNWKFSRVQNLARPTLRLRSGFGHDPWLAMSELRIMSSPSRESNGAPDRDRTYNLWLRRPTLYPIELRAPDENPILSASLHDFSSLRSPTEHDASYG
jgi:hypothetical protein